MLRYVGGRALGHRAQFRGLDAARVQLFSWMRWTLLAPTSGTRAQASHECANCCVIVTHGVCADLLPLGALLFCIAFAVAA